MSGSFPLEVLLLLLATTLIAALATGRRPSALAPWLLPLPALLALDRATLPMALPGLVLALFVADLWRNRSVMPMPRSAALSWSPARRFWPCCRSSLTTSWRPHSPP